MIDDADDELTDTTDFTDIRFDDDSSSLMDNHIENHAVVNTPMTVIFYDQLQAHKKILYSSVTYNSTINFKMRILISLIYFRLKFSAYQDERKANQILV